jgi:hypothetical protein
LPILLQVFLRKLTSEKSQWLHCRCMHKLTCNSKISSCPFPCTNVSCNNRCLFFRRLKISHESHEFILDPGTVANKKDGSLTSQQLSKCNYPHKMMCNRSTRPNPLPRTPQKSLIY